jgi:predicted alpha/beta hydrolase family esterase
MKKQVLFIHGGEVFSRYTNYIKFISDYKLDLNKKKPKKWKHSLSDKLGRNYEVIMTEMPCALNSKYKEWKIWFEKYIPFLKSPVILVGHSLGAIFLVKYLSENKLKKKIKGTFLVAAPYDDKDSWFSLDDFKIKKDLSLLTKQGGEVTFYFSEDDFEVPFVDAAKYQKALPDANYRIFKKRGHFLAPSFPEIVRDIKNLK